MCTCGVHGHTKFKIGEEQRKKEKKKRREKRRAEQKRSLAFRKKDLVEGDETPRSLASHRIFFSSLFATMCLDMKDSERLPQRDERRKDPKPEQARGEIAVKRSKAKHTSAITGSSKRRYRLTLLCLFLFYNVCSLSYVVASDSSKLPCQRDTDEKDQ